MKKNTKNNDIVVSGYTIKALTFGNAQKINKDNIVVYPWYTFKTPHIEPPTSKMIENRIREYILNNSTPKLDIINDIPCEMCIEIINKLLKSCV